VLLVVLFEYVFLFSDKLTQQSLCALCLIVNTGEYYRDRADQFAAGMRSRVSDQKLRQVIDAEKTVNEIKSKYLFIYFFNFPPSSSS
jgi:hypothetical protein